jgi:hypothetical protein
MTCAATACDDAEGDSEGTGGDGTGAGATTGSNNTSGPGGNTTTTASGPTTSSTGSGQGGAPTSVESWFSSDFNDLNANGSNLYDFANRYPQETQRLGTVWTHTHTEDQGWLGSPAPHVTVHGCEPGPACNTSEHQFNIGWTSPPVGASPALGESVFIRYRIKFDPGTEFHMGQFGAKFILYGQTGVEPNSRWIIHLFPPKANQGCTLGFESYEAMGFYPAEWAWHEASDWGFADFGAAPALHQYASFQSNINIGWSCNPGALVTRSDHASPVPKPQNRGEAAVGGWTHLQFEAVPNPAGQSTFRSWANNNDQAMPSSEHVDMPEGLGIVGWDGGVDVGGYWGIAANPDIGFIIDDFEIGPLFDPNWAQ